MPKNSKVSAKHPEIKLLDSWIDCFENCNKTKPIYTHQLYTLKSSCPQDICDQLFEYIKHAHAGAIEALRAPLADRLHPCDYGTKKDPAFGYPHKLEIVTKQGFFGEIFGGIIAENYVDSGGYEWEVPAYLFKFHITAFQSLERSRQTDDYTRKVVGRTGDDGLAFARDAEGNIVAWLAIEAKCTSDHSANLISSNHQKLSEPTASPIDLLRMIDALGDYKDDTYQQKWIATLKDFYLADTNSVQRYDLSVYVYSRPPKKQDTWIPKDKPHNEYTGNRGLCSAEFYSPEIVSLIQKIYDNFEA